MHHRFSNRASCLAHRLAPGASSTASNVAASMRPNSAGSNCTLFSRRHPRQLANSQVKKAGHCFPDRYFHLRFEVCVRLVMCLDFGLSLEQRPYARMRASCLMRSASVIIKTPMPECAVPTTALWNTSRLRRNGVLILQSVNGIISASVLLCEPLSVFFF